MQKFGLVVLAFLLSSIIGNVYAEGDPRAGKMKAAACASCHGQDGIGDNPMFPILAGQQARYIVQQTIDFREGRRVDPIMTGMAATMVNQQDLEDVAAYYASLPPRAKLPEMSDRALDIGKRLYDVKLQCKLCHGGQGEGVTGERSASPRIGGQHTGYLVKAMKEFRAGTRRSNGSYMMDMVLQRMTDEQIEAVAEYVASLSGNSARGAALASRD